MDTQQDPLYPDRKTEFWNGVKAIFPLIVGAIPFGIIYGALAVASGLSPLASQAMSLFVFAGSAQFIATGFIASGVSLGVIIFTTFIVNLRHMLYAATLAPHVEDMPHRWMLPLGFWLTDEAFVTVIGRYQQKDSSPYKHFYFLGAALFMYLNWQLCTLIGILAGQALDDPLRWGMDFAMIVTFIGMLIPMMKDKPTWVAVLVSGVVSLLTNSLPNKLGLVIAALVGVAAGVLAQRLLNRSGIAEEVAHE